jgi:peptidoglycan biosynthesis protein MviN/MurJ (putative lipid II flippase)
MADEPWDNLPTSGPPAAETPPGEHGVLSKIARAAFTILFFQIFWKLAGFFLNVLIGSFWGPSVHADAFLFVSDNVIFLLQSFSLKVAIPVLVPVFKEQKDGLGEEKAWEFLNTVVNLILVVQAIVMVAGMIYASDFIAMAGSGFNRETEHLATLMMRWSMPGVFLISFATVTYAILNSYNEFGYAAAGDAVQKILWFVTFFVLGMLWSKLGGAGAVVPLEIMIVSFLVGAAANILAHLVGLRQRLRFYRLGFPQLSGARALKEAGILLGFGIVLFAVGTTLAGRNTSQAVLQVACAAVVSAYLLLLWWRAKQLNTGMAKFAALCVPLLFGIFLAKYRDLFTSYFATFTGTGGFSDLRLARKIADLPNSLIAQAVGIAILPYLCELAQNRKWADFERVMTRTLKVMFMIFVPLSIAAVVLSDSLIDLLLNRGDWLSWDLRHAGHALALYILALLFFAIENPLSQSFFSMQRMWIPTIIGFVMTVFHLLFLFVGIKVFGLDIFVMVAWVYPLVRILKGIVLVVAMRTLVPILPLRSTGVFLAKMVVCCGIPGLLMWGSHQLVTAVVDVSPYRAREVMVDTFNVEAKDWNSENMVEFEIAPRPDDASSNCLKGRYVASPRRRAIIRRVMDGCNLAPRKKLGLEIRSKRPISLAAQLVSDQEALEPVQTFQLRPDEWQTITFEVARSPKTGSWNMLQVWDASETTNMAENQIWVDNLTLDQLVLDDFDPTAKGWSGRAEYQVVDLNQEEIVADLKSKGLSEDEARALAIRYPRRSRQQVQVVDWLQRHMPKELRGSPVDYLRKAIEEDRQPPEAFGSLPQVHVEYSLLTGRQGSSPLVVRRTLEAFRLAGQKELRFKAKSDVTARLRLTLIGPKASAAAEVEIKRNQTRKAYAVPLKSFKPTDGSFSLAEVTELRLEELDDTVSEGLWLDNIQFVRPVRRLPFEAFKLLHCLIPTIFGAGAFVLLLWALRVEEAGEVAAWLRETGMEKIRRKLRRFRKK